MSTRALVLTALGSAAEQGVSGEAIARSLGISRVAVAKHIAALRKAGYEIEAQAGEGYRLVSRPDLPLPDEVAPLLTEPFWVRIEGREVTGSTNDDARELARGGAAEGTVVVAARQTAGRGRFQREWVSPVGGVYASAVLRPPVGTTELAPLPLVIAVGVAAGLETLGLVPSLKWPNDILLDGRKVAGILVEMSGQADRVDWVVAGVGINVASLEVSGIGAVGAVAEHAQGRRLAEVAAVVLDGMARAYLRWQAEGFEGLRADFVSRHALQEERVSVRDAFGREVASGQVLGVDDLGRLLIRGRDSVIPVASGEATLRT